MKDAQQKQCDCEESATKPQKYKQKISLYTFFKVKYMYPTSCQRHLGSVGDGCFREM